MPPPTPLLAGIPTALTQSPAASYMPQVVITLRVRCTTRWLVTCRPVNGLRPPRAKRRRHPGQVGTGDPQRALPEVHVEDLVGITFEHTEALQHVGDRPVAASGGLLRAVHIVVEFEPAPGECRVELPHQRESLVGARRREPATPPRLRPALIIGFFGVLVVLSTLISLNASPEGSTPMCASTACWPSWSSASA